MTSPRTVHASRRVMGIFILAHLGCATPSASERIAVAMGEYNCSATMTLNDGATLQGAFNFDKSRKSEVWTHNQIEFKETIVSWFNVQGAITKKERYTNNHLVESVTYEYDAQNRLILSEADIADDGELTIDGRIDQRRWYEYAPGTRTEFIDLKSPFGPPDDVADAKTISTLNAQNQSIVDAYFLGESHVETTEHTYESGHILRSLTFAPDSELIINETRYSYEGERMISKTETSSLKGSTTTVYHACRT